MRFSARQQYCLEAMGMVPWVSRVEPCTNGTAETDVASDTQVPAVVMPAGILTDEKVPADLAALPVWLANQPLASFLSAGRQRTVIGADEAPLLVVVQTGPGECQQPLEGDAARLFDLMMRSINVSRQQLRLCALATDPNAMQATIPDVCHPQTKAVLLLLQDWNVSGETVPPEADGIRMDAPALPLWRVAHPEVLLRQNSLKRQAWHSLQALSRVL